MLKIVKIGLLMLAAVITIHVASAQNITVSSAVGEDIGTFINTHLVGEGVYVYNVKFGNQAGNVTKAQIGTFDANGYTGLNMDSGVVITTGNISVAPGPNNTGGKSASVAGAYNDSQMQSIASGSITSCGTLDFDFVSVSPFVTVNYCFGSEEYPEFVASVYNDVFAFFVTGPDPNSPTLAEATWNAAIIPHTVDATHPNGIAVAINSVNRGQAGSNGDPNCTTCYFNYSDYYVSNHTPSGECNNANGVQYDGFTQKLAASTNVVPCEEYHMHISICNAGDNAYDSGVFLEAGSFNSPSADVQLSRLTIDTIYRSHPMTVPLSIYGSSYTYGMADITFGGTAVVNTDYTCTTADGTVLGTMSEAVDLTDSTQGLTIVGTPGADLMEPKTIEIYISTNLCSQYPDLRNYDTMRFVLTEDDIVWLRDTTISCVDTCFEVGVEVVYAARPLEFQWIPEDGIDYPTRQYSHALITESSEYKVVARDDAGNSDTATVTIEIRDGIGIDDVQQNDVKIYPNPVDNRMNIEAEGMTRVEVYDSEGVMVHAADVSGNRHVVDTRSLPSGIYAVRINTSQGQSVRKIAVVR